MTSVVDVPRAASALVKPTRPERAVTRRSTPEARSAATNRRPIVCAEERNHSISRLRMRGGSQLAEGAPYAVLDEADIVRGAGPGWSCCGGRQRAGRRRRPCAGRSPRRSRIPIMNSNPAMTASTRLYPTATWSDSNRRSRRCGRWHVAKMSPAVNGRAWPRAIGGGPSGSRRGCGPPSFVLTVEPSQLDELHTKRATTTRRREIGCYY